MRVNSNAIANLSFSIACLAFVALAALRLRDGIVKPISPSAPDVIQSIDANISINEAEVQGDPKAQLVVLEFSDFQCPFCGRFARETYESLKKDYVDKGTLRYAFMNFPLQAHPLAQKASEAAECAGEQGRFWQMHDRLFANQDLLAPDELHRHALSLGLTASTFQRCLDGAMAPRILRNIATGQGLGVKSTPTFLLGRLQSDGTARMSLQIVGAHPDLVFRRALEQLQLKAKAKAKGSGAT